MMFRPDIVIFAFNRPKHLEQCLITLAAACCASECNLTIYCDGPRNESDVPLVEAVRTVAYSAHGFKSISVVARESNLGCAASVILGITQSFENCDRLAIFEDDILVSPHTLTYLSECLEKYAHFQSVFSISAWTPPPSLLKLPDSYAFDAYFVPRCNIWGWGTWKDRWQSVDWGVSDYTEFRDNSLLRRAFNSAGDDLSDMLADQMNGSVDAWDIRMDYSRFKHGCVGLNPTVSYTTNIGMGSGTHTTTYTNRYDNEISKALAAPRLPEHVFVDGDVLDAYRKVYARPCLCERAANKVWRTFFGKNLFVR